MCVCVCVGGGGGGGDVTHDTHVPYHHTMHEIPTMSFCMTFNPTIYKESRLRLLCCCVTRLNVTRYLHYTTLQKHKHLKPPKNTVKINATL